MPFTRIISSITTKKIALIAILAMGFAAFLGSFFMPASAGNQRVVTIHDGGKTKTVTTDAASVRDVLDRLAVRIGNKDLVEPNTNTMLVSPSYTVNIYRARPVTIVDGNNRQQIMTPYQSGRSIVTHAGIRLYDEDNVKNERIENVVADDAFGLKVLIERATPMTLVLYGTPTTIRTQANTVGELLQEKAIVLGSQDGMSVPAETPITENMILDVWRNGAQTKTEEQPVAFDIERIQNTEKEVGFRQITEPGQLGKKMVTYQIELRNGKEVSRKEIQSVVVQQPKKQVEIVGAKPGFSGSFAEALARLRQCEAGGSYTRNSGNGYSGAYQFSASAWRSWAPAEYKSVMAYQAPPAAQDQAVWNYYKKSGWRPWPACSQKLGLPDIYR